MTAGIATLTSDPDVGAILAALAEGLRQALPDTLVALWLTGSLTYGDFDRGSSDIDYLAVLAADLSGDQRAELAALHMGIGERWPVWSARIEGSYVTRDMLIHVVPPPMPRPYVNGGAFWEPDPRYGNEWLINLYALRERGVALIGPEPRNVIPPIDIGDVRRASARDMCEEWVPKLADDAFLESSHHQAYVALTLCRILHRAENDAVVSKRVAAAWVKERFPEPWIVDLVERAERWQHGEELDRADDVRRFIAVARDLVAAP